MKLFCHLFAVVQVRSLVTHAHLDRTRRGQELGAALSVKLAITAPLLQVSASPHPLINSVSASPFHLPIH